MDARFTPVARDSEILEGKMFGASVGDVPVLLVHLGGVIYAIGRICTHEDQDLAEGWIESSCLVCPRHGSKFDLPVYDVLVKDGLVYVCRRCLGRTLCGLEDSHYRKIGEAEDTMKLVTAIDAEKLERAVLIAESGEFAIFDVGGDTYALVHRHAAVEWQAITISGDGLFRVAEILAQATRRLYRDVASDLSKRQRQ